MASVLTSSQASSYANTPNMAQLGDIVPSHFNGAIVTASYFASLCGCLLTVEALHRRGTGVHNWRSWQVADPYQVEFHH